MSVQVVLIELGALFLLCSSVTLVRMRLLSIRYGLGWIGVSLAGLVAGPILALVSVQARVLGFTETGFSLGVFIAFLVLLCLQLSISLSGLHYAVQDLSEHGALVEERLRRLEGADRADGHAHVDADPEWSGRR